MFMNTPWIFSQDQSIFATEGKIIQHQRAAWKFDRGFTDGAFGGCRSIQIYVLRVSAERAQSIINILKFIDLSFTLCCDFEVFCLFSAINCRSAA